MRYAITGATVDQVRSVGATDIKEARSTGIIFATLTEEQVSRLKSQGCTVSKVGEVRTAVMPPIVAPPVPVAAVPLYSPEQLIFAAGLESLRNLFIPPLYGEGFNAAVIDTGIRETHEKIRGHVIYRRNFTSDPMEDGFNHGTGVASIITTLAPKSGILNMKVLDNRGSGTEEDVVLAIDECITLHQSQSEIAPSTINLSLGSPDDGNPNSPLRIACRAALKEGIWVFAAAGNAGPAPRTITSPACEGYVGAVGSIGPVTADDKIVGFIISNFSSRGPTMEGLVKPDGVMFGENIVLASSTDDTATIPKSGTSFSVAFASGMALVYFEGAYKYAQVKRQVTEPPFGTLVPISQEYLIDTYLPSVSAKPQGVAAGKDYDYGYGMPYGPYIAQYISQVLGLKPAVSLESIIAPLFGIGILGIMMKALK
jgi:serine protease AprX